MLHAIINNKAGRIEISGAKVPLRQIYKEREDMITAAVFSRLPYLSNLARQKLLSRLLPGADVPFHQLVRTEFWPRFSSAIQDTVEPDVVLRFEWGTLLIEVKRPHGGAQDGEQWYRELEALPDEYWEDRVLFWAVGGDRGRNQQIIAELEERLEQNEMVNGSVALFATDWREFAIALDQLRGADSELAQSDEAVLADILAALDLYSVSYREIKLRDLCNERWEGISGALRLKGWEQPDGKCDSASEVVGAAFDRWPSFGRLEGIQRKAWTDWHTRVRQATRSMGGRISWTELQRYGPIAEASITIIKGVKAANLFNQDRK